MNDIKSLIKKQNDFFATNETRTLAFRKTQLQKLLDSIKSHEHEIILALKLDLNKAPFESYETEIGMVYEELRFMIKNIKSLSKRKKIKTPLMHFPSRSYQYHDPLGCVLIMSPWNYPFQLTISPLIGAISAGNCTMVKPSNYAKSTSAVIKKILSVFNDDYICVVEGGRAVNQELLDEKFDLIFFTGSPVVGKLVMSKAAEHLTPVVLELGGKSPCLVDSTANIDLSAKRIVWGKLLNSGQTCVAPDYLLVHEDVKEKFVEALQKYIKLFYGEHPETNVEYPKIINENHFNRLCSLIENSTDVIGGKSNAKTMQIAPAIIDNCDWNSLVMEDELFGPILPILTFKNIDEVIFDINKRAKPLALYCFTTSKDNEKKVLTNITFGGGCINDTIIHLANTNLPFGGVGESGMGKYHGKESFYTFSHSKSILKKGLFLDLYVRYAPYKSKIKILRKVLK